MKNTVFFVAHQLQSCSPDNPAIILEPVGRNTAPAAAVAALHALKQGTEEDPVLLTPKMSTSLPRWIYNRFFMSVEA